MNNRTENYVLKKEVDYSLLKEGLAIPIEHQVVFGRLMDRFLQRGESKPITIYFNGKSYKAKLQNQSINSKYQARKSDKLQIRYTPNGELAQALQRMFSSSYRFIEYERRLREPGSRKSIRLPDDCKEYLAIYTTEYDDSYIFEAIQAKDIQELMQAVRGKSERFLESAFDIHEIDPLAGYLESDGIRKIRKLNHKIGENLKLLYGYRCQICGCVVGKEYGSHIAEAHHIDYFVHSLNNDASNQIILCPNHHSLIHDADPAFDRKRLLYVYANGIEQKIVVNKHL